MPRSIWDIGHDEQYPISFSDIKKRVQARQSVIHNMSEPSTDPLIELSNKVIPTIDYSGGRLPWLQEWMTDPSDSYPFVEWEDLTGSEKAYVLIKRIGWAIEAFGYEITVVQQKNLAARMESVDEALPNVEATTWAAEALRDAVEASNDERKKQVGPQPARPGHLMAEGSSLLTAKSRVKNGYARKVTFSEPVNAFTMLNGDKIALPGDMLTGVTVSDTVEFETQDVLSGRVRKTYTAKAVSL